MIIKTMWGRRAAEYNQMPELMVAWDEYCEDSYPEGFAKECDEARASWGDDLVAWRRIDIDVSLVQISEAFAPAVVVASAARATEGS